MKRPSPLALQVRRVLLACILGSFGIASLTRAFADVLHLRDGTSVEGRVEVDEKTKVYRVTTASGVVAEFPADRVVRHEKRQTAFDEFDRRWRETDKSDRDALLRLALWTREKGLRSELRRVAQSVLRLDPNNEVARAALGYVVFENRWVLESELRKKHGELGLVKFEGEWMTTAEKERRLTEETAREVRDLFENVASKNRHLQEFAIERLLAFRHPKGREILAPWLDDPREIVRIVAASALTSFAVPKSDRKSDPEAAEITRRIFDRLLGAESYAEAEGMTLALRFFQPRESFVLSLGVLREPKSDPTRLERAEEVAFQALRKAWVPELCRALVV
ncbi:MAG TPA: hypothetical protein VK116_14420, partial [Planctomycetota bacterium]|nr:hypothetical protein [Planctomycetota bacterium]